MNLLSQPITLPSTSVVSNRLVKAATSESLATLDGRPTDALIRLYERWAQGGAGAIITGNVMVDRRGQESPRNVLVEDRRHISDLRRWADAVHDHDTALWMQINHAGRAAPRRTTLEPLAPSAVQMRGFGPLMARPARARWRRGRRDYPTLRHDRLHRC